MIHRIRTIDSHAAGEPLRLIVEGLPSPEGDTMLAKRAWAQKHIDHLRRSLMLEPRGHAEARLGRSPRALEGEPAGGLDR